MAKSEFARRTMGRRPPRRRGRTVRLEVQTLSGSTSADSRGHSQKSFSTYQTVHAFVKQLRGEEAQFAREIVPRATHEVEIDYLAKVKPRSRFKFPNESRYLNVESVDNIEERGRTMVCLCHEQVSS